MKQIVPVLLTVLLILPIAAAEAKGGEDVEPDITGSPITTIDHSTEVPDESEWSITITLVEQAAQNNTTVRILYQMCTNEGTCDSPDYMEVESSADNSTWDASVMTIDDHAYVNWVVSLLYEDGEEEKFPGSGYAKAWSSCWYDINSNTWGGKDCPDGPEGSDDDEDSFLPSIGFLGAMAMMAFAARYLTRVD